MRLRLVASIAAAVLVSLPAHADVVWTDWAAAVAGTPTGSAVGLAGDVVVTYSGEVLSNTQVSGSTNISGGASINYWEGGQTPVGTSPYTSATVPNAPPANDVITLQGGPGSGTNTITFSEAVLNPVMAILSLGQNDPFRVRYSFNRDFTILSSGTGYWGGAASGSLFEENNDLLLGIEGHGTIMFPGLVSSISWVASPTEFWHGFQIAVIPEPETYAMLLAGLGLLGFMARRRKTALGRFAV